MNQNRNRWQGFNQTETQQTFRKPMIETAGMPRQQCDVTSRQLLWEQGPAQTVVFDVAHQEMRFPATGLLENLVVGRNDYTRLCDNPWLRN